MKYVVDYRGPDGSRQQKEIEAADRKSVFAQLERMGISAISVREGVKAEKSSSAFPSIVKVVVAGAVIVALAAVVWLIVADSEEPKTIAEGNSERRIKEVSSAKPDCVNVVKEVEPTEDPARSARRKMLAEMSVEERINYRFEELSKKPAELDPSTGKAYRNGLEQVMSWLFTCEVGNAPPVLPEIPIQDEAQLVSILISPNDIVEGDDEEVQQAKKAVEVAKSELIKYIKDGGDVKSFLKFYHNELLQANEEYNMAHQEVKSLARKDPEIAVEYFNRINSKLIERGIKTVRPNKRLLDLAEEQGVELKY